MHLAPTRIDGIKLPGPRNRPPLRPASRDGPVRAAPQRPLESRTGAAYRPSLGWTEFTRCNEPYRRRRQSTWSRWEATIWRRGITGSRASACRRVHIGQGRFGLDDLRATHASARMVGACCPGASASARLATVRASAHLVPQPQRKHPEYRGAAAELVTVLAIEGRGVAACCRRRVVGLAPARVAVTLALPAHDRAFCPESVAVPEHATTQHQMIIAHGRRRVRGSRTVA
jgi:hypothetical protein